MSRDKFTHLQIRRVQNGFVVFCYNHVMDMARMEGQYSVASLVAKDADELGRLVTNMAECSDLEWLASADLPLIDLKVRG